MIHTNNNFTQLNLELQNSRITLTPSDDEKFHLTSKREHEYSFTENDQTFVLSQAKWRWYHHVLPFIGWRLPTRTELKIPTTFKGKISFSNRNGWVCLNNFECDNINISNRNGKLFGNGIKAVNFEFFANNGKVELQNIKTENLKGTARNGKIILNDIDTETIDCKSNNGKVLLNKIQTEMVEISANNGKIICNDATAERIKLETKNSKVMGSNIDTATIDAGTKNGKLVFERLDAYSVNLQTSNGKIRTSFCGEEKDYSFEVKVYNGKSVIAGKKNTGSYILKDSDKKKQITATTKNGSVFFVFLNSSKK